VKHSSARLLHLGGRCRQHAGVLAHLGPFNDGHPPPATRRDAHGVVTGELDDRKRSRPVREGAVGKGSNDEGPAGILRRGPSSPEHVLTDRDADIIKSRDRQHECGGHRVYCLLLDWQRTKHRLEHRRES
jgi:hypothetical protein